MEKLSCNYCGSLSHVTVYKDIPDDATMEKFNIVRCSECGLFFTMPRPEKQKIGNYYPTTYYYSYKQKKEYLTARIALMVKKYYVSPPQNPLKRILVGTVARLLKKNIAILIEGRGDGRKILDVGCGDGRRVAWLLKYDFRVYGTDISKEALKIARENGINTFCGDLTEANYPSEFFDIIIFSQVFEHLYEPMKMLEECFRILKHGGLLIIDVPNIDYILHKIYGKYWVHLDVPRHLFHYSVQTLSNYLQKQGFTIIFWKYRYPKFFDLASIKRVYKYGGLFLVISSILSSIKLLLIYPFKRNRDNLFSQTVAVYARK